MFGLLMHAVIATAGEPQASQLMERSGSHAQGVTDRDWITEKKYL